MASRKSLSRQTSPAAASASDDAVRNDDTKLTDARVPTSHHTTHSTGGTDPIAPADIGAQPVDSDLTTIAGLTATSDNFMVAASSAWASRTPAQAKTSLALSKSDVGLGSVDNTSDTGKPVSTAQQTALDGKQPLDSDLTTIAGLTATTDNFMVAASSAWASRTPTQAKTSLALTKSDVGLGSVDNTSDVGKPVSTAQQTALDLKAPTSRTLTAGTGLTGGGDLSADRTFTIAYGTSSSTACVGNDSRLSDSRTPTAHKSSHAIGGGDVLSPSDIGAQPVDSDLTTIAGLTPTTDNFMVAAASAWASRTPAQAKTSLAITESDVSGLVTDLAGKVPLSTLTAKGDLFAATGSAAVDNLAVGSDGQVLTADSAQTMGVKWATAAGGSGDLPSHYPLSGYGLVAAACHPDDAQAGGSASLLATNTLWVIRMYVPANMLITGGFVYVQTAGATPGSTNASGFVLFDDSGTRLAITTNDYTIFTATGWRSKAFSASYTTGSTGEWLRAGVVSSCTSTPTVKIGPTVDATFINSTRTGAQRRDVSQTAVTTMPASITPSSYGTATGSAYPFFGLY